MRALVVIGALAGCDQVYGLDERPKTDALGGDAAGTYAAEVLADSPVAYYRMGEKTSVVCNDEVGDKDGTYAGTYQLGAMGALSGDPDTAVRFGGPDDAGAVFGDVFEFDGTDAFSLEAWVNVMDDARNFNDLITKYAQPPISTGYLIYTKDDILTFQRGVTQTNETLLEFFGFETHKFFHVVGTYDGTMMRLYINGALIDMKNSGISLPDQTVGFVIGSGNGRIDSAPTNGIIDEVAIYPGALPAARVFAHFMAGRPPE